MTPQEIGERAIKKMNKKLTNEIFMLILNDRDLMYHYLKAVENDGLDKVNTLIGKKVKEAYGLKKASTRETKPSCTLIQSHQEFE